MCLKLFYISLILALSAQARAEMICINTSEPDFTIIQFVQSGRSGAVSFEYNSRQTGAVTKGTIDVAQSWSNNGFLGFDGSNAENQSASVELFMADRSSVFGSLSLEFPDGNSRFKKSFLVACTH